MATFFLINFTRYMFGSRVFYRLPLTTNLHGYDLQRQKRNLKLCCLATAIMTMLIVKGSLCQSLITEMNGYLVPQRAMQTKMVPPMYVIKSL